MIGRALASSERFWDCSTEARLLYVMALPQTDRDGRLPGSPRKLLARCVPMSGWSVCELTRMREELVCAGLWLLYEDQPGREVIQVEKFHEHQPGMRPESERYGREAASKFAPPPVRTPDSHAPHTQGGADSPASVPEGKRREIEDNSTTARGGVTVGKDRAPPRSGEGETARPEAPQTAPVANGELDVSTEEGKDRLRQIQERALARVRSEERAQSSDGTGSRPERAMTRGADDA